MIFLLININVFLSATYFGNDENNNSQSFLINNTGEVDQISNQDAPMSTPDPEFPALNPDKSLTYDYNNIYSLQDESNKNMSSGPGLSTMGNGQNPLSFFPKPEYSYSPYSNTHNGSTGQLLGDDTASRMPFAGIASTPKARMNSLIMNNINNRIALNKQAQIANNSLHGHYLNNSGLVGNSMAFPGIQNNVMMHNNGYYVDNQHGLMHVNEMNAKAGNKAQIARLASVNQKISQNLFLREKFKRNLDTKLKTYQLNRQLKKNSYFARLYNIYQNVSAKLKNIRMPY